MQLRQVAPRHAHIDMVGQMPPGVVRHHPHASNEGLPDDMGREATIA